ARGEGPYWRAQTLLGTGGGFRARPPRRAPPHLTAMPFAHVNGHRCYYRVEGLDDRPVVVLSHSLGLDHGMWEALTRQLLPFYGVVRYDTRGHGASEATPGDYAIAQLAHDALALADALDLKTFAFCGLALGGGVGPGARRHG